MVRRQRLSKVCIEREELDESEALFPSSDIGKAPANLTDEENAAETPDSSSSKKGKGKSKKESDLPVFADADEYQAMIEKSFNDLKRGAQEEDDTTEGDSNNKEFSSPKKKKKNSKSRKKRKKSLLLFYTSKSHQRVQ